MDTLNNLAYWIVTGAFWLFLSCGALLLTVTFLIWLKLSKQDPDWRLSWKQALKDLTLPASGFAAAIMLLGRDPSERWMVYVAALIFFLTSNLASRYATRGELSIWRLARKSS